MTFYEKNSGKKKFIFGMSVNKPYYKSKFLFQISEGSQIEKSLFFV